MASESRKTRHQRALKTSTPASTKALGLGPNCMRCGKPGTHFVPPSLGDVGFFACDPPADIRNHTCRELCAARGCQHETEEG